MSGLDVVRVTVVVVEDGKEKQALEVGYFHSQPYAVLIATPDGVDRRYDGIATKEGSAERQRLNAEAMLTREGSESFGA